MTTVSSLINCLGLALLAVLQTQPAIAFEDAFDDGNGDGWTHFDPLVEVKLSAPSTLSFENGVFVMEPNPPAADPAGPARVFSYIEGEILTDFYCAVDIVDWNDNIDQAFGILGRVDNIGLGQTTGYVCNYDPNQTSGQPGGQFQINRIIDEASNPTIAVGNVKLIQEHSYRMVFRGEGNRLIGALYDLADLTSPVVQIETDGDLNADAVTFKEGLVGLFSFYRGDDLTEPHAKPSVTFDNFVSAPENPAPQWLPGIDRGVPSQPQVVRHTPTSGANLHPATEGLSFDVASNEHPGPFEIQVTLNDILVPDDEITYTSEDGLTKGVVRNLDPNQIYEARITVGEVVSAWRFDTFEESLMNSGEAIVVEVEDYNFGAGQFLDQPVASGVTEAGVQLPGADKSFYDRMAEPEIDYHDTDGAPVSENDYRSDDLVGLRSGSLEIDPGELLRDAARQYHVMNGARDYEVFRTEAGEWLNYTRNFPPGDYQIYLRAAAQASQDVRLDRVTGDRTRPNQTTAPLGRFALANQGSRFAWRFTPLTDSDGSPLTLALSGETTLRLTLDGEENAFAFRRILALNYLLFVPAAQDDPNLVVARSGLFGEVSGIETTALRLRNSGASQPLTIGSVLIQGEDADHFTATEPPASLNPGETASIDVRFDPNGQEGVFVAELVITSNDERSPAIHVDLTAHIPVSSGLLVHYPFDDAAGSTVAKDVSGNRRNGIYAHSNGATLTLDQPGLASGSAVRLNNGGAGGGTAHIEIPIAARLPALKSMTTSLWFRQDSGATNVTVLSKGLEPADPFAIAMDQGSFAWGSAGEAVLQTGAVFSAETTHHLVVRYQDGEVALILDGTMIGEPTVGPTFEDGSPTPLLIGALSGGVLGFSGVLDDFQLYARTLEDAEIAFLHDNPGKPLGLTDSPMPVVTTTQISKGEAGTHRLTILGPGERTYTLESSETLTSESWTVIREVEGVEGSLFIELEEEDSPKRFFRLRY